nr:MgtC/SapB family protein [Streptomyces sp. NRRL S-813]
MVLGAAIGLERQWRLRNAGIRTNALVSVGASLFVVMGAVGLGENSGADPTRVAAQVVSGIGFLGAGVILRDGVNIRGLTTAATLWCAAAIGSLAGAGMEVVALIGCGAIIATNTLLRPLVRIVDGRQRQAGASLQQAEDEDEASL